MKWITTFQPSNVITIDLPIKPEKANLFRMSAFLMREQV